MGIINNDTFITSSNISLTRTYIGIGYSRINLSKQKINTGIDTYTLIVNFNIYKDLDSKNAGNIPLETYIITKNLTVDDFSTSLYTHAYNELKTIFTNYSDSI